MSDPLLYYEPEDQTLLYFYNNQWFDATNLVQFQPELSQLIPIYSFPQGTYTSDPVFVIMGDDWVLLQSNGDQLQKLAQTTPGPNFITHVIRLVNPYGSVGPFSMNWFQHLVNLKNLGLPFNV